MPKKLTKFVERKQDDFLTILEKNWRDWFLKPITTLLYLIGITANQITIFGLFLIALSILGFPYGLSIKIQFLILILATLSDTIDGPRARNHNQVTSLGTWLDHIRDGFLVGWMTFLIYYFDILTIEWIIIIWTIQVVLVWLILKDFLIKILSSPMELWHKVSHDYSFARLQASVIGRLQFFFWSVGYLILLLFLLLPKENLIVFGKSFLILSVIFATLNMYEAYTKR